MAYTFKPKTEPAPTKLSAAIRFTETLDWNKLTNEEFTLIISAPEVRGANTVQEKVLKILAEHARHTSPA